jgi:hypothetical protein
MLTSLFFVSFIDNNIAQHFPDLFHFWRLCGVGSNAVVHKTDFAAQSLYFRLRCFLNLKMVWQNPKTEKNRL